MQCLSPIYFCHSNVDIYISSRDYRTYPFQFIEIRPKVITQLTQTETETTNRCVFMHILFMLMFPNSLKNAGTSFSCFSFVGYQRKYARTFICCSLATWLMLYMPGLSGCLEHQCNVVLLNLHCMHWCIKTNRTFLQAIKTLLLAAFFFFYFFMFSFFCVPARVKSLPYLDTEGLQK